MYAENLSDGCAIHEKRKEGKHAQKQAKCKNQNITQNFFAHASAFCKCRRTKKKEEETGDLVSTYFKTRARRRPPPPARWPSQTHRRSQGSPPHCRRWHCTRWRPRRNHSTSACTERAETRRVNMRAQNIGIEEQYFPYLSWKKQ